MKLGIWLAPTWILASIVGLSQGCEGIDARSIVDASQLPSASTERDSAVVADAAFIEELPQMLDDDGNVGADRVTCRTSSAADSGGPGQR